jgi:DNA-binding MarR family transcriptional regulator
MPEPSIGLSALGLLATLHREGAMHATELATAERLQPQSLSRMIGTLERQRLIVRHRDAGDKRIIILAITLEGRRLLKQDMQQRRKWLDDKMRAVLSEAERDILLEASTLMLRIADAPHG